MSHGTYVYLPDFTHNLVMASFSSAIARSILTPIEKFKQISSEPNPKGEHQTFIRHVIKLYKESQLSTLWRGNSQRISRYIPRQACNFAFKDMFIHDIYLHGPKPQSVKDIFIIHAFSGGFAGAVAAMILYPIDLARTRISFDAISKDITMPRQYLGLWQCLSKTRKLNGFKGLYEGFSLSLLGSIVYRSIYFGGYDTLKKVAEVDGAGPRLSVQLLIGLSVATAANFATYPINKIRGKLMTYSDRKIVFEKSTIKGLIKIYRAEGLKMFYEGMLTNSPKPIVIANALALILYDGIQKMFLDFNMTRNTEERNIWR